MLPLIKERKQQRKVTVYELADDICAIPPWNPVHFFYKDQENLLLFKRLANYCNAIQFSVPELKRLYGYLNLSSAIFLNQISIVPPEREFESRPEIIIGWGGSHGHLEDMAEVAEPLIDWVISRDNIQLYLMCSDPIWSLFDRLPPTRKRRFKTGSLDDYYAFLRKIDIGLAPLKDTAFNRSRSDVKFLEYAVHAVVPVVQASAPYSSTVKQGETGFLFEDAAVMLDILEILTGNVHLISKMAQAARDYVIRERLQHQHGKERAEFYRKKLAELHNIQEGNNGTGKIFGAFSSIEGAICRGRHLKLMPTRVEGELALACSLFSEASQMEPKNYLPFLLGAPSSEDTVGWLYQAMERNPNSVKAWILLGGQYAKKGDIQRSIKCFESAAGVFPDYEIPFLKSAAILQKVGHKEDSICLIDKGKALTMPLQGPS